MSSTGEAGKPCTGNCTAHLPFLEKRHVDHRSSGLHSAHLPITYWHSCPSIGEALIDTVDDLINEGRIEPQLAMKILNNFDRVVAEVLADKVKARLTFKVSNTAVPGWP
jgi:hypothetical protein